MMQTGGRGDAIAAVGLLATTLFLGGGSVLFPGFRLLVELIAVLALAWFAWRPWQWPRGWPVWTALAILAGGVLTLVTQLIPLPPSIWQNLPARGDAVAVFTAAGAGDHAAPLSLNAAATRASLAFFLVPIAVFLVVLRSDARVRQFLLWAVVSFAILNGIMIVLQFQGFPWLTLYSSYGRPGTGLFANKNHSALFLVTTMPAVAWMVMDSWHGAPLATRRWIAAATTGFLSLTVFGCLSRAGLALLPIGLVATGIIISIGRPMGRRTMIMFGCVAALMVPLAFVLPQTAVVARALERFDAGSDLRYQFWPVVVDATKAYFPAGSGFGTFPEVFAAREPLAIVKPTFVNHAHSDYLEIVLEGGAPAAVLVICFLAWFGVIAVMRLWTCRQSRINLAPVVIAVAGMIEMMLHSILDYPLRTLALASLAAMYCAMLAAPSSPLDLQPHKRYRTKVRRTAR